MTDTLSPRAAGQPALTPSSTAPIAVPSSGPTLPPNHQAPPSSTRSRSMPAPASITGTDAHAALPPPPSPPPTPLREITFPWPPINAAGATLDPLMFCMAEGPDLEKVLAIEVFPRTLSPSARRAAKRPKGLMQMFVDSAGYTAPHGDPVTQVANNRGRRPLAPRTVPAIVPSRNAGPAMFITAGVTPPMSEADAQAAAATRSPKLRKVPGHGKNKPPTQSNTHAQTMPMPTHAHETQQGVHLNPRSVPRPEVESTSQPASSVASSSSFPIYWKVQPRQPTQPTQQSQQQHHVHAVPPQRPVTIMDSAPPPNALPPDILTSDRRSMGIVGPAALMSGYPVFVDQALPSSTSTASHAQYLSPTALFSTPATAPSPSAFSLASTSEGSSVPARSPRVSAGSHGMRTRAHPYATQASASSVGNVHSVGTLRRDPTLSYHTHIHHPYPIPAAQVHMPGSMTMQVPPPTHNQQIHPASEPMCHPQMPQLQAQYTQLQAQAQAYAQTQAQAFIASQPVPPLQLLQQFTEFSRASQSVVTPAVGHPTSTPVMEHHGHHAQSSTPSQHINEAEATAGGQKHAESTKSPTTFEGKAAECDGQQSQLRTIPPEQVPQQAPERPLSSHTSSPAETPGESVAVQRARNNGVTPMSVHAHHPIHHQQLQQLERLYRFPSDQQQAGFQQQLYLQELQQQVHLQQLQQRQLLQQRQSERQQQHHPLQQLSQQHVQQHVQHQLAQQQLHQPYHLQQQPLWHLQQQHGDPHPVQQHWQFQNAQCTMSPPVPLQAMTPMTPVDATPTPSHNKPKARRPRTLTEAQLRVLIQHFEVDRMPIAETREELARQLGLSAKYVKYWFDKRRSKESLPIKPPFDNARPPPVLAALWSLIDEDDEHLSVMAIDMMRISGWLREGAEGGNIAVAIRKSPPQLLLYTAYDGCTYRITLPLTPNAFSNVHTRVSTLSGAHHHRLLIRFDLAPGVATFAKNEGYWESCTDFTSGPASRGGRCEIMGREETMHQMCATMQALIAAGYRPISRNAQQPVAAASFLPRLVPQPTAAVAVPDPIFAFDISALTPATTASISTTASSTNADDADASTLLDRDALETTTASAVWSSLANVELPELSTMADETGNAGNTDELGQPTPSSAPATAPAAPPREPAFPWGGVNADAGAADVTPADHGPGGCVEGNDRGEEEAGMVGGGLGPSALASTADM